MTRSVRRARLDDMDRLLELAHHRRQRYATYEPVFWRPATGALDAQRPFYGALVEDREAGVFVAVDGERIEGFVIARIVDTPPVYDPGGGTCLVDDFTVADDAQWSWAGPMLLKQVRAWAAARDAAQVVVVTGHRDEGKRELLRHAGLSLASEWWTGPT